jgi:hypothetical protein
MVGILNCFGAGDTEATGSDIYVVFVRTTGRVSVQNNSGRPYLDGISDISVLALACLLYDHDPLPVF